MRSGVLQKTMYFFRTSAIISGILSLCRDKEVQRMVRLSNEDILFFKREGYLIKRNVLDSGSDGASEGSVVGTVRRPPWNDMISKTWVGPIKTGRRMRRYDECETWLPMELPRTGRSKIGWFGCLPQIQMCGGWQSSFWVRETYRRPMGFEASTARSLTVMNLKNRLPAM